MLISVVAMPSKSKDPNNSLRHVVLRITRVHFVYVLVYMLAIIIFDSWNLIAHESVIQRWTAAGALLIVNTIIWYLCRAKINNQQLYKILLIILLISDVLFAAINIYWQRGMASKAVFLFMIPIISAALTKSRSLLLATATVSAAVYSIAAVRYFYDFYGQGYRVELYGEIFFYSAMMFVVAGLLMISFRKAPD